MNLPGEKDQEASDRGVEAQGYTGGGIRSHYILIVLFLLYISNYGDRFVVSGMLEFIKRDWSLSDAQAGWLTTIVILFITIFTVPVAVLIDRWSRRKMISMMVFLWSLATLACAFTRNFGQLLAARALTGIGESGFAPAGTALLSAAYPEGKRAKVMGIWNIAIPLGVGAGMMAGGLIARRWGWQHAFGLVAVPGMLLALASWFLPDYRSVTVEEPASGSGHLGGFLTRATGLFRSPALVFTYLGFAMNVAVSTALMAWLPSYYERTGLAEPGGGGTYTMPILGLVVVGAPLGGYLSDVWHRRRKEGRLVFPAITSVLGAVILFVAFLCPGRMVQVGIMVLYGILATCYVAPAASVTQDLVHPGLRALSYGMCVIVQHLCGDVWSPVLVGWLSDQVGLASAVRVLPFFGILGGVSFYAGSRFYLADLARVENVELRAE